MNFDLHDRNFGFIYGALGKSFFIIFIAFLSFGLGDPESLTLATGVIWASFGAGQVALYLKYPEWFDTDTEGRQTDGAGGGVDTVQ